MCLVVQRAGPHLDCHAMLAQDAKQVVLQSCGIPQHLDVLAQRSRLPINPGNKGVSDT